MRAKIALLDCHTILGDRDGDEQADDRIGQRVAQPDTGGAEQHREARQAVDARVVAVGDERGALDLPAHLDANHGGDLVAGETHDRCPSHCAEVIDLLRMQESLDGLVTRDDGTEGDDEHDDDARKVFHSPITVRKATAGFSSRQRKCRP